MLATTMISPRSEIHHGDVFVCAPKQPHSTSIACDQAQSPLMEKANPSIPIIKVAPSRHRAARMAAPQTSSIQGRENPCSFGKRA